MSTDHIVVRDAKPGEFEYVGDLLVGAYQTLGDVGDASYDEILRDVASRARTSRVLVAVVEGNVVGTVTYISPDGDLAEVDDPKAATIRMLGVAPVARGQGIGEALVRSCLAEARRDGAARVRLDTRTSMTSAQRLYERLGFERDPEHDWSPARGIELIAYTVELEPD